jgi:hypothetical protein
VPFVAAAHEHVEPAFTATATLGDAVESGPHDVPAYGYIRHIRLEVETSGGTKGSATFADDYPFNILERVVLQDVNGSPICELDGYALFVSNLIGGYAFRQDPREQADYSDGFVCKFTVRIPVEISHHDALGSISNQNAAAAYKVTVRLRSAADVYGTAPTAAPSVKIRAYLEAWSLPAETDLAGRPQAQVPPAHGTSQYWSSYNRSILNGQNSVSLSRMGNLIRNLVFITRDSDGTRSDDSFPDSVRFVWDANTLVDQSRRGNRETVNERLNSDLGLPDGVFAYTFDNSLLNRAGDGLPSLWLATVQSSRMELQGTTTQEGNIQVITNDIAPVEVAPQDRYQVPNDTGFTPQVA